jgi:hypothetical protein
MGTVLLSCQDKWAIVLQIFLMWGNIVQIYFFVDAM